MAIEGPSRPVDIAPVLPAVGDAVPPAAGDAVPPAVGGASPGDDSGNTYLGNLGRFILNMASTAVATVAGFVYAAVVFTVNCFAQALGYCTHIFNLIIYQPLIAPIVETHYPEVPIARNRPLPLENNGNTCYMASGLQFLFCSPVFVEHFLEYMSESDSLPNSEGRPEDVASPTPLVQSEAILPPPPSALLGGEQPMPEAARAAPSSKGKEPVTVSAENIPSLVQALVPVQVQVPVIDNEQLAAFDRHIMDMVSYMRGTEERVQEMKALRYRPSLREVRMALSASNDFPCIGVAQVTRTLNEEFKRTRPTKPPTPSDIQRYINGQQDAGELVVYLADRFLKDCKLFLKKHITLENLGDAEMTSDEEHLVFSLPIGGQRQTVRSILEAYFQPHHNASDMRIERGTPLNSGDVDIQVDSYFERFSVTNYPPILMFQFQRFAPDAAGRLRKNAADIDLEDGVIDLSPYYNGADEEDGFYKIKSIVNHAGATMHSGHYFASVDSDGTYYNCNDRKITPFQSRGKFLENRQGYLVLLERITKEEYDKLSRPSVAEVAGPAPALTLMPAPAPTPAPIPTPTPVPTPAPDELDENQAGPPLTVLPASSVKPAV